MTDFYDVDLPDGSMIAGQVIATSYWDGEGRLKYAVGTVGELNLAQAVGLLELCKISTYRSYMESEPYEPDDVEEIEEEEDEDE